MQVCQPTHCNSVKPTRRTLTEGQTPNTSVQSIYTIAENDSQADFKLGSLKIIASEATYHTSVTFDWCTMCSQLLTSSAVHSKDLFPTTCPLPGETPATHTRQVKVGCTGLPPRLSTQNFQIPDD